MCGRLLADLGAEVVKVEPRGGAEERRWGPFKDDVPHPERSLYFLYSNSNKKGIQLDLLDSADRETFKELVKRADVVIESFQPGYLASLGLGYDALQSLNPGLVMGSVSGFGQTGPHSQYKAPEIVSFAMGGVMYLSGDSDKPPLSMPYEVGYQLASVYTAVGVLIAARQRRLSGRGQHVDVSSQEVQASQQYIVVNYSALENLLSRMGSRSARGGSAPNGAYRCKDGFAEFFILSPWHWRNLFDWMGRPEALNDPIWENRHFRAQNVDVIDPYIHEFAAKFNKLEISEEAQRRHIPIVPINTPGEFFDDPQTRHRGTFEEANHPEVGPHFILGAPYKLSESPCVVRRTAPLLGQHNREVSESWLAEKPRPAAAKAAPPTPGKRALEGIRIIDVGMAIAGPEVSGLLAEHGAEVIMVESATHQRRGRDFPDPRVVLQQKVTFGGLNRNKKAITINLNTAEGQELFRDLVRVSDVVVENFNPKIMKRWGLDYENLRKVKPDIILVDMPAFGMSGPRSEYLGAAATTAAFSGLYHIWSYAGTDEPAAPNSVLPDYVAAIYATLATMAALHYHTLTGKGQSVDLSHADAMASLMGPMYLDYLVNDRIAQPVGNWHPHAAPHGSYQCRGDDAWCVIACFTEEEWQALRAVMGEPRWCGDPRFASLEQRLENRTELDRYLGEWTREYTPRQVMRTLQRAGIASGVVQSGEDLIYDHHLRARSYLTTMDHPDTGPVEYPGVTMSLSETPGRIDGWASQGEHNRLVFEGILGLSAEKVNELVRTEVVI
jgi:crotonobetainyl-CoA:carnitine CoA-transferase CaiB-like acyl-CoA transferase